MTTLILGCGYLGKAVALALIARNPNSAVFGTTRSESKASSLRAIGVYSILADVLDPESLAGLPRADRVFLSVGFDRSSGSTREQVGMIGMRNVLHALKSRGWAGRLVASSSTSVYGQADGRWVDEDSETISLDESGRIALGAESLVHAAEPSATILRFSGIYGPDRIIGQAMLERGEAIPGDPDRWLNLIHVEDAAQAVVAALDATESGRLYVVSDDSPLRRREYYECAAASLGLPAPRFEGTGASLSQVPDKRVLNSRVKAELGLTWRYPKFAAEHDGVSRPLA